MIPAGASARVAGSAVLVLTALVVAGCPVKPIVFGPRGRLTDPREALETIIARRDRVHTVRGEAKVNIDSSKGGGNVTELIAAEWPNRLRLESMSFFGNPLSVLTSDGRNYAVFDLDHHRFQQGPATPEALAGVLPVALLPEQVVSLLLGVPPLLEATPQMSLDIDERERTYALHLKHGAAEEVIGLDPKTLRPVWVRLNAAAALTPWEGRFDHYDEDTELPRDVQVTTSNPYARVDLHWRDREVNAALPDSLFTQPVPEGM